MKDWDKWTSEMMGIICKTAPETFEFDDLCCFLSSAALTIAGGDKDLASKGLLVASCGVLDFESIRLPMEKSH